MLSNNGWVGCAQELTRNRETTEAFGFTNTRAFQQCQRATTGTKKLKTWCKTSTSPKTAGTKTLKCNLGSRGRRALRRASLKLTLRTTFTPSKGAPASSVRKLTIKRKR